jgi:hypothetical protein
MFAQKYYYFSGAFSIVGQGIDYTASDLYKSLQSY